MRPYRDWAILVALAGIGVALLLAIDIYMFIAVNTPPDIRESPQARLQETIDREALADTIELYRQKEQRLEELRAAPPTISAPR